MPRRPALPKDPSQRAKALLDAVVNHDPQLQEPAPTGDATTLGRLGGLKGGRARAEALSPQKRKAIAKKAAAARWGNGGSGGRDKKRS